MNEFCTSIDVSGDGVNVFASNTRFPEEWFFEAVSWGRSSSGIAVNPQTALRHAPVWQAVNILAGDVGQIPLRKMVRRVKGGVEATEKDVGHRLDWLMAQQPNEYQTPSVWKETVMKDALLWGNHVSFIGEQNGRTVLLPLPPESTHYEEVAPYEFQITTRIDNKQLTFEYIDCFHIRGLSHNGFWGMSLVDILKDAIGHGLALQAHGSRTFANSAQPGGVLETDHKMPPEARKNLRTEWDAMHSGARNAGKIAILENGLKFRQTSMSNEDAEFLASRRFDREIIASIFNLPAFKLNALENSATRSNLEEQNRDYFNTSLSRWTNRFAEECERKLLTPTERRFRRHFFRWFPEAFLKGDIATRYTAYATAITNRWMNPNEVRDKEDMNPYEGGDDYANPAIDTQKAKEPEPVEPVEEDDDQMTAIANRASVVLASQCSEIVERESFQVRWAAKHVSQYVPWAESFYAAFPGKAAAKLQPALDVAEAAGLICNHEAALKDHATSHFHRVLDMAGMVTKEELPQAAVREADLIRNSADDLFRSILGAIQ